MSKKVTRQPVTKNKTDVTQPKIKDPIPETKTMEVHHHPEVEKKGFKEYLLEGLMIFLAVTMGFFAENLREDYTEHSKAKAYAETMATDLKTDTANLANYIAYYKFAQANIDTMMKLLSNPDIKQVATGKLYLFGLWGGAQRFFIQDDATFQQMKSTGALQFFEKAVARKASEYDQLCRKMQQFDAGDEAVYVEVRKLRSQIFDFNYNTGSANVWAQISSQYTYPTQKADIAKLDSFINLKPALLSYDRSTINQYVEMARSRYIVRKVIIADSVLVHARELLSAVKKQYNVADE